MDLFNSLSAALSGLDAAMASLQTTGHNIANASTPGFSRQRVVLDPRPSLDNTPVRLGQGVSVDKIQRVIDQALQGQIQDAAASLGRLGITNDTLHNIESVLGALSGQDVGSAMDKFFSALQDLSNNPADPATRSQVLDNAKTVADTFNAVSGQLRTSQKDLNDELLTDVDQVNHITDEIASLNRQVVNAEHGGLDGGAANDLRDQRDLLVSRLSQFLHVKTVETSTGELNVLSGSAFLVFGQQSFDLTTTTKVKNNVQISTPVFANGSATLPIQDGKLGGLIDARDNVVGGLLKNLDILANQTIFQFNQVQSTGQGLERFSQMTSTGSIPKPTVPIAIAGSATSLSTLNTITDFSLIGFPDQTGRHVLILTGQNQLEERTVTAFDTVHGTLFLDSDLPAPMAIGDKFQINELNFPVVNGSFKMVVTNEVTGVQQSSTINVDLDKIGPDTTLNNIATQINAVAPGTITATVLPSGRLQIQSSSSDVTFSFAKDSSGFLAAMGLNPFFDGSNSGDIAVDSNLMADQKLLSTAQSNTAGDNSNALAFAGLRSANVVNGATLEGFYQGTASALGSQTADIKNQFNNQTLISQQLDNQRERTSGVNIDEESVHMLESQRVYQASARFIAVVDQLLQTLVTSL